MYIFGCLPCDLYFWVNFQTLGRSQRNDNVMLTFSDEERRLTFASETQRYKDILLTLLLLSSSSYIQRRTFTAKL